ncbi:Polycomb group RING finger protein 1 [Hordeum vulgare]|uniref:Predicted protein n=1 Tax=Hordeum vulgare subsp. vulgare TaxID=112509 RepID=F2DCL6_HORVV|nr:E3 ubiquitin protein ligase DRIP2-like [Hordeum vulgare subsp. vulgare]KAE8807620.1 Polycomb group RING finger protein 1 [Hordeum vulgare]KAI4987937.1 hypothetical protein ZWY2020_029567 [Hordeum vulgare]BAJ92837.1 predicted protein [Hordeum vulgare subsp. vulgare]
MQSGPASPTPPEDTPMAAAAAAAVAEVEVMEEADGEQAKEDAVKVAEPQPERGVKRGRGRPRRRPVAVDGSGVVMVKREQLARCMTCKLCHRLLREATTISECLHTFCRKCIYKKLNDEELDHCPVCKIDLGCAPVEKLRADHNKQDVRSKIFPLKRNKIDAKESPVSLPIKRKERSISSLVVDTPRITTGLTGRRTRAVTRKAAAALRGLGPILDPVERDNGSANKHPDNLSLLDSLSKVPQTRRKASSIADTSSHNSNKDKAGDDKDLDKADLWKPLNCLVEAASKTKSFRSCSSVKGDQPNGSPSSEQASREKPVENLRKTRFQDDKKDAPQSVVLKKKGPGRTKNATSVAAAIQKDQYSTALNPVWFSLIASFEQKGDPPLPQIPAHFLRIKDGSIAASSIQRYIMQKLSLGSESEVELSCCGQSINPIQPVHNLMDRWLRVGPSRHLQTSVGSSGGDYVMVITYGRPKS